MYCVKILCVFNRQNDEHSIRHSADYLIRASHSLLNAFQPN